MARVWRGLSLLASLRIWGIFKEYWSVNGNTNLREVCSLITIRLKQVWHDIHTLHEQHFTESCLKVISMLFLVSLMQGGSTPLSSWSPRAIKKSTFYIKDHQNRSNFFISFSWVNIHNVYYIVKIVTKFEDFFYIYNIPFLTRMM